MQIARAFVKIYHDKEAEKMSDKQIEKLVECVKEQGGGFGVELVASYEMRELIGHGVG